MIVIRGIRNSEDNPRRAARHDGNFEGRALVILSLLLRALAAERDRAASARFSQGRGR